MRTPHMKFQKKKKKKKKIAYIVQNLCYAHQNTRLNSLKLQKAITPTTFHLIPWNFYQVISS